VTSYTGVVVRGDGVGRQLGFPTANVRGEAPPPERGVWAVRVSGAGLSRRPGVCNVGVRPTVGGAALVVEVHLPGFSGDLYGKTLELSFIAKLRQERKFSSLDELKAQIALDIAASSRYNKPMEEPRVNADGNVIGRLGALIVLAGFGLWFGRFLCAGATCSFCR
jgi:riboflavin kinase/FMN adenylyltransferase